MKLWHCKTGNIRVILFVHDIFMCMIFLIQQKFTIVTVDKIQKRSFWHILIMFILKVWNYANSEENRENLADVFVV
jgi:hypothetical protein